ncbi:hypothetical protein OR16_38392 [Cupriavidus basilensis OR16]|uniref:Fe2OG dioxygenase domain-containing protein n=1 Tax=Cupriavidus basilensis OR16 TaxID=1127483 RepID=H1SGY7_9BURK|nr:hypothetical protein OR16_38392 [Cupriavidus basilensis OR16]
MHASKTPLRTPNAGTPTAARRANAAACGGGSLDIDQRVQAISWQDVETGLDQVGCAVIRHLLGSAECDALTALYGRADLYRSRVIMGRHGFGRGEYQYFSYPLPDIIEELRAAIYPHLVPMANRWNEAMGISVRYPSRHAQFIRRCHDAGQVRPTPLILQYGQDDYNCLHQDLYGEHVFPLQAAILLSQPGDDFTGGEFVMTEQRPHMQPRAEVVALGKGDALVFTVNQRPVRGTRDYCRVAHRHGVSRLHSGQRHTVGIIFHDSK